MRKSFKNYNQEPQINILPMIDIIFVILSFFIISSLYLVKLESIPLNLPNAKTSKNELNDPIIISLDIAGNIYINKNYSKRKSFESDISKLIASKDKEFVLIRADKEIKYGEVIYVLDILRKFSNLKIAVSTDPK
tara:strand:- start:40 stop:444 length:405 start_codon:yes stop_codon:yes gene_type:complete